MHKTKNALLIILSLLIYSCQNTNSENKLQDPGQKVILGKGDQVAENKRFETEKKRISALLQGKWKEEAYPFRTAEFTDTRVKFVEEGTEHAPKFEGFDLGIECPFENTNIKDNGSQILLLLPEQRRCEKLSVSNDTLILSGHSTDTKSDYQILYLRVK